MPTSWARRLSWSKYYRVSKMDRMPYLSGDFPQKSLMVNGSFPARDLQLQASCAPSPPLTSRPKSIFATVYFWPRLNLRTTFVPVSLLWIAGSSWCCAAAFMVPSFADITRLRGAGSLESSGKCIFCGQSNCASQTRRSALQILKWSWFQNSIHFTHFKYCDRITPFLEQIQKIIP